MPSTLDDFYWQEFKLYDLEVLLLLRRTDRGVYDDSFLLLFWWLLLLLVVGNISISCCCCWWCCCCWFCCCCCFFLSIVPKVLASDPLPLLNDFQNFILTFLWSSFLTRNVAFNIFSLAFTVLCTSLASKLFVTKFYLLNDKI